IPEECITAPLETDFGGEDHAIALTSLCDGTPDDLLGVPEAVGRRCVDEVDATVERGMDRPHGFIVVGAAPLKPAHGPCPEADPAGWDPDIGNSRRLHIHLGPPLRSSLRCLAIGEFDVPLPPRPAARPRRR